MARLADRATSIYGDLEVSTVGAAKFDITIEQGSDFQLVVTVVGGPVSMTGYTGKMQIRPGKGSAELRYDVATSAITVDSTNRQVVVDLPWTETNGFSWDSGMYDLVIVSSDQADVWRVAEGKAIVDHSVTKVA